MHEIEIRIARPGDAKVEWLAALDSRETPAGEVLVAEVGGQPLAAVSWDGSAAIADPFQRTADVVELLRVRSAQLRGKRVRGRRRRPRPQPAIQSAA